MKIMGFAILETLVVLACICSIIIISKFQALVNKLDAVVAVKKCRRVNKLAILVLVATIALSVLSGSIELYWLLSTGMDLGLTVMFCASIALAAYFCYILNSYVRGNEQLNSISPNVLVSQYFQKRYSSCLDEGDIEGADNAITNACMIAPDRVLPWLLRSTFAYEYLNDPASEIKYFRIAQENRDKEERLDDQTASLYYLCKGSLLDRSGNQKDAIACFERSLYFEHNPVIAECIGNMKNDMDEKLDNGW